MTLPTAPFAAPAIRTPEEVAGQYRRAIRENVYRGLMPRDGYAAAVREQLLGAARYHDERAPADLAARLQRDLLPEDRAWIRHTLAACPEIAACLRRLADA